MAAIKLHVYMGTNDGTKSCDFRGDKFIGAEDGDWHRTIGEVDPATEEAVTAVVEHGAAINAILDKLDLSGAVGGVIDAIRGEFGLQGVEVQGKVGFRLGVWDD